MNKNVDRTVQLIGWMGVGLLVIVVLMLVLG